METSFKPFFHWQLALTPSLLHTNTAQDLLNAFLRQHPHDTPENAQIPLPKSIPAALIDLLHESRFYLHGLHARVLAHSMTPVVTPSVNSRLLNDNMTQEARPIALERLFLRLQSCYFTGRTEEHASLLAAFDAHQKSQPELILWIRLEIFAAARDMHIGCFKNALSKLVGLQTKVHALGLHALGMFDTLRWHSIFAFCHQACGNFVLAARSLKEQEMLLPEIDLADFNHGFTRRKITFCLDTEDYHRAEKLIHKTLRDSRLTPANRLLVLKEKLRFSLAKGESHEVAHIFSEIERVAALHNLSENFAALIEERCDAALSKTPMDLGAVRLQMEEQRNKALARNDRAALCTSSLFLGRLLAQMGHFDEAQEVLQQAQDIAQDEEYGRVLVRVLLFRSGLAALMGHETRAVFLLTQAEHLARALPLPVHQACCEMLRSQLLRTALPAEELVKLFNRLKSPGEFTQFMNYYGLPDRTRLKVALTGKKPVVYDSVIQGWKDIHFTPGCYLLASQRCVCLADGKTMQLFKVDSSSLVERALTLVIQGHPKIFSLADLHHISLPQVTYQASKHAAKVRTLLRRMRQRLTGSGLEIVVVESAKESYKLSTRLPFFELQIDHHTRLRPKTDELRERLIASISGAPGGQITTHELCSTFALSRQRLSYLLEKSRAAGLVGIRNRGRLSCYFMVQEQTKTPPQRVGHFVR